MDINKLRAAIDDMEFQTKDLRKACDISLRGEISLPKEKGRIYIDIAHPSEYYLYGALYNPDQDVYVTSYVLECQGKKMTPALAYYNLGQLCLEVLRYKEAVDAYKKAIIWDPVNVDYFFALAEAYKMLGMMERYKNVTDEAYKLCVTRATYARYLRNYGWYCTKAYMPKTARACYRLSNLVFPTANADDGLKFLDEALDGLKEYEFKNVTSSKVGNSELLTDYKENLSLEGIKTGIDSKSVELYHAIGGQLLKEGDYPAAVDCFKMVYDVTAEPKILELIEECEGYIG